MAGSYARYSGFSGSAGSGTVTSVGLSDGSTVPIYTISGSPVTTVGTLTFSLATQSANLVFAGPTTGAAAQPGFRSLVLADFPSIANNTVLGNKSGSSAVPSALSLGTVTESTSSVLTLTGWSNATVGSPTIQVTQSSGSTSGYLSSSDWTTFNNKQAAGNYITALTGDGTASGPGSATFTLATVNSNVGSFGSSTAIPSLTVNGKGLITAASTNVVIAPAGTLTGTTLASNVVTSSLTTVGTIGTGVWHGTAIAAGFGGTGIDSSASTGAAQVASGVWTVAALNLASASYVTGLLGASHGGTGIDSSASTGAARVASGTWTVGALDISSSSYVTGILSAANGGTGSSNGSYVTGGIVYAVTTSQFTTTGGGTHGQVITSNGGGGSSPSFQNRDNFVGTAQTSDGTQSTNAFAAFTNNPTVSFTAGATGNYKIFGNFVAAGNTQNNAYDIQIAATAGSPTTVFSQVSRENQNVAGGQQLYAPYLIVGLTFGTTYTFELQGRCQVNGNTLTLSNSAVSGGQALCAEQWC